jgi:large subunit ribosomal protein L21
VVYAVVKAGGKQHRVAVGDVVEVNRLEGDAGDAVSLPALLVVDGRTVVSDTSALAKVAVTGEIVGHHKGPKIKILKYKNKTGYRRRIGHRQLLTELLVTDIDDGKPKKKAKAEAAKATKAEPAKAAKATKAEPAKATSTAKAAKTAKTAGKATDEKKD